MFLVSVIPFAKSCSAFSCARVAFAHEPVISCISRFAYLPSAATCAADSIRRLKSNTASV
jgi:hypothetical protein